jgi:hypothetical protein
VIQTSIEQHATINVRASRNSSDQSILHAVKASASKAKAAKRQLAPNRE